jgi:hypothetical protein
MAYVPGYTGDVFISYAHLDNGDGWVTEVKSRLAARLTADLAGEPEIWFDADRLKTGDVFKQTIQDKIDNTLMLIAVISPAFLNSSFCMEQELGSFLDRLGREVIQLLKVPLTEGQSAPLPDAIYEQLFDETSGTPLRGEPLSAKLDQIAWTVRKKMEDARQSCTKIYLAQPKSDALRSTCRDLKRVLHNNTFAVLPNEIVTQRTLESKIQKWMEDAVLSIHVQTDPPDPLAERQLNIAKQAGTPMIILHGAPRKTELPAIAQRVRLEVASIRRKGEVYFIYDHHSDLMQAHQLHPEIERRSGRKVTLPQPGETYHKAKLSESDGIILFRGTAPLPWYEAQRQTLHQASALRGPRVVPEAHYLVAQGAPERVKLVQPAQARWEIQRIGAPDIKDLQPFFEALFNSAAATGG